LKKRSILAKFSGLCLAAALACTAFAFGSDSLSASATVPSTGACISELTGLPINAALRNQRPIAVMVDNEKTALPHFGLYQADVVYEMMNSTANGRITRLMAIIKDWGSITQLGSIRSTRPTNFMVAAEYNAILVHDGGPACYNQAYEKLPYTDHLSGGFARFSNGKATEFTEYVTYGGYKNPKTGKSYAGLASRIAKEGISTTYNGYYQGQGFRFAGTDYTPAGTAASRIALPFPHNKSQLAYNAATGTYDYYEYGAAHKDAALGIQTTFKNVILISCSYVKLDKNGYLVYNILGNGPGYYITNGSCTPINWSKNADCAHTVYTNAAGAMINLNPGKTYIAIVPSDVWNQVVIQ